MTLTIVKRYNGKGNEIDESYQPIIPELVELLSEIYHKINTACITEKSDNISA